MNKLTSETIKYWAKASINDRSRLIPFSVAQKFVKQSKLLSQLLTKSWYDDQKGQAIRAIILNKDQNERDFTDLLSGKKSELFGKIFDDEEIKLYSFVINWDVFEGSMTENHQAMIQQKPPYFTLNLPYPPKPSDSNLDLDNEDFKKWLNSTVDINDDNVQVTDPFPPIPYLPLTTC
jgi:hypothetical protein